MRRAKLGLTDPFPWHGVPNAGLGQVRWHTGTILGETGRHSLAYKTMHGDTSTVPVYVAANKPRFRRAHLLGLEGTKLCIFLEKNKCRI